MKNRSYLWLLFCALPLFGQEPEIETEKPTETETSTEASQSVPDYDSFDNAVDLNERDPEDGPRQPQQSPEKVELGSTYIRMLGSLFLVLGLIMGLAWAAKRFLPKQLMGGATQGENLKLVQSLPLGPKRFVSLIEADGQRILIGVTDEKISLIKSLDNNFEKTMIEMEEPKTVREWEAET